jgi:hypothetical protein
MRYFRLRSLLGLESPTIPNEHELNLVKSPLLYSLTLRFVRRDSNNHPDYNSKVIFMVSAMAPNVKHINISRSRAAASPALMRRDPDPSNTKARVPWKGYIPSLELSKKGSLISLMYPGSRLGMSLGHLEKWSEHLDMSKLRYLLLGEVTDVRVFKFMTDDINLSSLEMLGVETEDLSGLQSLLEHLSPLKEFRLLRSGVPFHLPDSLLVKIFQRHGAALRRLTLD